MSVVAQQASQWTDRDVPRHIAIVMDGNGRWARSRSLPRHVGHRAGVKATKRIVEACGKRGVSVLTLFAFSSENWSRPRQEVGMLMSLFVEALQREIDELHDNEVRLIVIGERSSLSATLRTQIQQAEELTCENSGLQLVIAVGYGGRWDLVQAARCVASDVERGMLSASAVDEAALSGHLALAGLPDPDLFIRTGGEHRISNFLLWNLAYTELLFSDTLWPDFDDSNLDEAIRIYASRQRRFGQLEEQLGASPG